MYSGKRGEIDAAGYEKRRPRNDDKRVLSEFWVFQEKVDMKVSAFSFTTLFLIFGYL